MDRPALLDVMPSDPPSAPPIAGTRPNAGDVEPFWSRGGAADGEVRLAVVVPTFRRPGHLERTLLSVMAQVPPLGPFAIVVMENDPEGREGARVAARLLADRAGPSRVVLANRRGNCAAYNAGFWTALTAYPALEWVCIIDDDEIARPGWLAALMACAARTGADAVGAPQVPVVEGNARMAAHPVFAPPYAASGTVPILHSSGNVGVRADLLRRMGHPFLDERFNFLGGGDSDFFARAKARGARFAWCVEAALDETIPTGRMAASWVNARARRNGAISAAIQRKAARRPRDHAARLAKTAALLAAAPPRAALLGLRTGSFTTAMNPVQVALGRLLMEFGVAGEQYREPKD